MTAPARFYQDDVARAVKGCIAGGMEVGTVRVLPDGAIEVYRTGLQLVGAPIPEAPNPLDRVLGDDP